MPVSFYIAKRYLFSKKSRNVVNIISGVSLTGVIVGTTALVVVLSIFNGFDVLIKTFFSSFDPEFKVEVVKGKQFSVDTPELFFLKNHPDVAYYSEVVEQIALFRYKERQVIAILKGVDESYMQMSDLDSLMYDGHFMVDDGNFDYAVLGLGVASSIGMSVNFVSPLQIIVPQKGNHNHLFSSPIRQKHAFISGIYAVDQQEIDGKYVLTSIDFARNLLQMNNKVTAIELAVKPGIDKKRFQKDIQNSLSDKFVIKNRYEQHESYYRIMKSENVVIYLILTFILLIASFNLAGSITMLLIDKKKDIHILNSMGLSKNKIAHIFLYEGMLVTLLGAIIGIVIGLLLCWGQLKFGWIKFPGSFAVDAYPVDVRGTSIVIIAITVIVIGGIASWLPIRILPKSFFNVATDE